MKPVRKSFSLGEEVEALLDDLAKETMGSRGTEARLIRSSVRILKAEAEARGKAFLWETIATEGRNYKPCTAVKGAANK
jgi:hypothetical protein